MNKPIRPESRKIYEGVYPEQPKSFKSQNTEHTMKKTLLFFLVILVVPMCIAYVAYLYRPHNLGTVHPLFALLVALSTAFAIVHFLKPFPRTKLFTCVPCVTGWIALILAYLFNVPYYLAYAPIGVLIGGLFEKIQMRYL